MEDKPSIVFVDTEPSLLSGLRRLLRNQRNSWDMHFIPEPRQATELLQNSHVDVLVCDIQLPGPAGKDLLTWACDEHPQTSRIMLTGSANRRAIISAVGPTQQFLSKPMDGTSLVGALSRVVETRRVIESPELKAILGSVQDLPKPPRIYQEMMELAARDDVPMGEVVRVIESDLATSAQALKLVNSAFFVLPGRVDNIERAVTLLGLDTIQALVIAGAVFKSQGEMPKGLSLDEITSRSMQTAALSKLYAQAEGWSSERIRDVFFASLLQEISLPLLASRYPEGWKQVRLRVPIDPIEQATHEVEAFGVPITHASAYILGMWGFNQTVIEILVQLHLSNKAETSGPNAEIIDAARRRVRYPRAPRFHTMYRTVERMNRWAEVEPEDLD